MYPRWISRIGAPLIAFVLTVAPSVSTVHAVEDARKVSVVSFGLFGDQGVFRSEATGAAQVVAGRFGSGPISVQYNSKKGGGATIEGLAMSLQAAANGMDAENDILLLILHLARLPRRPCSQSGAAYANAHAAKSRLHAGADRHATQGGGHLGLLFRGLYPSSREPRYAGNHRGRCRPSVVRLPDKAKWTYFGNAFFNIALRQAKSLKDAFVVARSLVKKRELRERFEPSNPLMAGGENVQPLLISRP